MASRDPERQASPHVTDWRRRRWLEITTNIGCAVRCSYCPQGRLIRAYRGSSRTTEMSLDTFQRCILKLPASVDLLFAGFSEPWLNPDCTEMVLQASRSGFNIDVYTTCVGMTTRDVDRLRTVRFGGFYVHLPNGREEMASTGDRQEYFDVLRALIASDIPNLEYIYHQTAPDPEGLDPVVADLLAEQGLRAVSWRLHSRAGNVSARLMPGPEVLLGRLVCREGRLHKNVLLPSGDVALCCMDWQLDHIIGNLLRSDYDALSTSPGFRRVERGLRDESVDLLCRTCEWAVPAPVGPSMEAGDD